MAAMFEMTLEEKLHGVANAHRLKELHRDKDYNALLEYALLLAESEAHQRCIARSMMQKDLSKPAAIVIDCPRCKCDK